MRIAFLAAALAVAAIAVGLLILLRSMEGGGSGELAGPGAPAEVGRPDRLVGPDPAVEAPGEAAPDASDEVDAPSPSETRRSTAGLRPTEGIRLRVVTGRRQEPVPGALVRFLDLDEYHRWQKDELRPDIEDEDRLLDELARSLETDDAGEVILPSARELRLVHASSRGPLWIDPLDRSDPAARGRGLPLDGRRWVEPDAPQPVLLTVAARFSLAVQVVDGDDRPIAGVPVSIGRLFGPQQRVPNTLASASTEGEEGIALFENAQRFVHLGSAGGGAIVLAYLPIPLEHRIEAVLDPEEPPQEPIRLVLPGPTGRVVVTMPEVPAESGSSWRPWASLWPVEAGAQAAAVHPGSPIGRVWPVEGRAVFPFVGLGLELEVRGFWPGLSGPVVRCAAGPVRPGQEVSIELATAGERPVVTGRVRDSEGRLLRSHALSGTMTIAGGPTVRSQHVPLPTDGDGEFRVELVDDPPPGGSRILEIVLHREEWNAPARAVVDLSRQLPRGVTDLGEIQLEAPPLVAAGRVVDDLGRPVEGAKLHFERAARQRGRQDRESWHWYWIHDVQVETDAEGRFESRGWCDRSGELGVSARKPGLPPSERVSFLAGARGLSLCMVRPGGIEGHLLLDDDIDPERLSIHLLRDPVEEPVRRSSRDGPSETRVRYAKRIPIPVERDGSFGSDSLEPGEAGLRVSGFRMLQPLVEIHGLRILPGETERDPRLQGIDLRGMLMDVELTLLGPAGDPVADAQVMLRAGPDASEVAGNHASDRRGRVRILGLRRPLTADISHPGLRAVRVPGIAADRTIELGPGLPVRLRLVRDGTLPDPPLVLGARFAFRGAPPDAKDGARPLHGPAFVSTDDFDAAGEVRAILDRPGRYWVHATLRDESASAPAYQVPRFIGRPRDAVVEDVPGEQEFELTVEWETLRRMEEQMRR